MDPLDTLHDIAEVTSTTWWPLAWGWWIAFICIAGLIVGLFILIKRRHKYNAAGKEAQRMLKHHQFASLAEVNTVGKRFAIAYGSRKEVAGLAGKEWLNFMIRTLPDTERKKLAPELNAYEQLLYQPATEGQVKDYQRLVLQWVEKAHV